MKPLIKSDIYWRIFDFFAEGEPFYSFFSLNVLDRLKFILKHNYGNLIYGLYRKSSLDKFNVVFCYNEIPFFLQVFEIGNWKVLPEVGIYKKTTTQTYIQAKWEVQGGVLKRNILRILLSVKSSYKYHKMAYDDITQSINNLFIDNVSKKALKSVVKNRLVKHFLTLLFGIKNKR